MDQSCEFSPKLLANGATMLGSWLGGEGHYDLGSLKRERSRNTCQGQPKGKQEACRTEIRINRKPSTTIIHDKHLQEAPTETTCNTHRKRSTAENRKKYPANQHWQQLPTTKESNKGIPRTKKTGEEYEREGSNPEVTAISSSLDGARVEHQRGESEEALSAQMLPPSTNIRLIVRIITSCGVIVSTPGAEATSSSADKPAAFWSCGTCRTCQTLASTQPRPAPVPRPNVLQGI
ncbi:hypothetical protein BJ508DRAFT_339735 [Ascobolus immersus RN42]|uniref:Uncharacterized protein n=1 Tax=Ascobolus immersus RN42 TaxID=1160509 RepID=A0A3N4HLW4_ASCIM|nr:hypothetical protein BJ508DRAFT_339735 [Ascobolus immersus RN42]